MQVYVGGPGSGKTSFLLGIVEQELNNGVRPGEIAFVSFTRAGANEAASRAGNKFGLGEEDLPWFRTIHSLAYARLNLSRDEVIDARDYKQFGQLIGERISGSYDASESPLPAGNKGDVMLRIIDFAATCLLPLQEAWHLMNEPVDWFELKRFDAAYRAYKADLGKIDFTDMLLTCTHDTPPLQAKVAVIDEAQDLTPAQWAVVRHVFSGCERVYIGGDDDQAIYRWAGADVNYFLNLTDRPTVLPKSHRLPEAVYHLAQAVAGRISRRYAKDYRHTGKKGRVEYHQLPEGVDISSGEWLMLARNRYQLNQLVTLARETGVNYSTRQGPAVEPAHVQAIRLWEHVRSGSVTQLTADQVRTLHATLGRAKPALRESDLYDPVTYYARALGEPWYDALIGISRSQLDYYMACVRRGEDLSTEPRVRIETIHGVKGAEADNVMLMTDMSSRTARGFDADPDSEHRVFYVGVTRAKSALHIVAPQSDNSYPL